MPDEQENVTDAGSEETTSTGAPAEGETKTQPLPPEVQEAIQEAASKAAKEATEAAKREIQSAKDKARREVEQAKAETTYHKTFASTYQGEFGQDDPDKAEIARLRAEKAARDKAAQEAEMVRSRDKFDADFRSNANQILTTMGVDPKDDRIDWAEDATGDYLARNRRILESAAKISQETAKSEKEKLEQRLKDIEAKLGEEANSVDTSASGGATGSDKDFLARWGSGELPATKENLIRAQKLQNKE